MQRSITESEGHITGGATGKPQVDPAQSETRCRRGHFWHGNREIPQTPAAEGAEGRSGKVTNRTPDVNVRGKSDRPIVPKKPSNKEGDVKASAEVVEGRGLTKGNARQPTAPRTQSRTGASPGLPGVRAAGRRNKRARFTALLHHVTVDLLRGSFYAMKREAAPGVDGMTWTQYEVGLEDRLRDLHERVHRGTYHAQPSKRPSSRKRMGECVPWASRPWKTRSFSTRW
jgi:RNA-directed DNA polymerase